MDQAKAKKKMSGKKLFYILALSAISILLVCLIGLQVAQQMGYFPDTDVLYTGEEMHPRHRLLLESAGILQQGETVNFFYSGGYFSVLEEGNLVTPDRFITYQKSGEKLDTFSIPYEELQDVQLNTDDSLHEGYSMLLVKATENRTFGIPVLQPQKADEEFYKGLVTSWKTKVPDLPESPNLQISE